MKKTRVLFLGNSHTYFNDMPQLFCRMCRETGICAPEVSMLARPYATYQDHLREETSLRYAVLYGGYDYLIMQQAAHSPCPSEEETLRDGGEIIRLARAQGIVPFQILPWAEKARPERQQALNEMYRRFARTMDVRLIPAGPIFHAARTRADIPDLYWQDGEHASPWGSCAIAAALYGTLFRRSPEGLSPVSLAFSKVTDARGQADWSCVPVSLEAEACASLQALVWDYVKREEP